MQINEFMHKHAALGILFVLSLGMWLGWFAVFQWQLCGQWCYSQSLVMKVQVFMVSVMLALCVYAFVGSASSLKNQVISALMAFCGMIWYKFAVYGANSDDYADFSYRMKAVGTLIVWNVVVFVAMQIRLVYLSHKEKSNVEHSIRDGVFPARHIKVSQLDGFGIGRAQMRIVICFNAVVGLLLQCLTQFNELVLILALLAMALVWVNFRSMARLEGTQAFVQQEGGEWLEVTSQGIAWQLLATKMKGKYLVHILPLHMVSGVIYWPDLDVIEYHKWRLELRLRSKQDVNLELRLAASVLPDGMDLKDFYHQLMKWQDLGLSVAAAKSMQ